MPIYSSIKEEIVYLASQVAGGEIMYRGLDDAAQRGTDAGY
jgi:hypothetical protein